MVDKARRCAAFCADIGRVKNKVARSSAKVLESAPILSVFGANVLTHPPRYFCCKVSTGKDLGVDFDSAFLTEMRGLCGFGGVGGVFCSLDLSSRSTFSAMQESCRLLPQTIPHVFAKSAKA